MNSGSSCDALRSPSSLWTLSRKTSDCKCCSSRASHNLTRSLSEDESDTDTHTPTSHGSGFSDDNHTQDEPAVVAGDADHDLARSPSMLEQSPIDIRETQCNATWRRTSQDRVSIAPCSDAAELVYTGHGFSVQWTGPVKDTLEIRGKIYHAVQFHFHTPSEHTLDGDHEAMELHLVHQASDGSLAVVAVFFRKGDTSPFLSQFWDELAELTLGVAATIPIGVIDTKPLRLLAGSYFRYRGSLTTPPYTEGVEWVVVRDIAEASREQLAAFRGVLPKPNARAVQNLNTREVSLVV